MFCDRHFWAKLYIASQPGWLLGWTSFTLGMSLHSFPLVLLHYLRKPYHSGWKLSCVTFSICSYHARLELPHPETLCGWWREADTPGGWFTPLSLAPSPSMEQITLWSCWCTTTAIKSILAGQPSVLGGSGKAGWLLSSGALPKALLVLPRGRLPKWKKKNTTSYVQCSCFLWILQSPDFPRQKVQCAAQAT